MKKSTAQITIALSERERISVEQFARRHSVSPEKAFRTDLFEKIEDEADLAIAEQAYREYLAEGKHSRPVSELCKELSL